MDLVQEAYAYDEWLDAFQLVEPLFWVQRIAKAKNRYVRVNNGAC